MKFIMNMRQKFEGPFALVAFPDESNQHNINKLAQNLEQFFTKVAPIMIMTGDSRLYIECAESLQRTLVHSEANSISGLEKWISERESRTLADRILDSMTPETVGLIVIADTRHTLTMPELLHRKARYMATPVPGGHALGIDRYGTRYMISSNNITMWADQSKW